jgi:hypothetical protein
MFEECCLLRYDWEAVQGYYDEGHSQMDCALRFGFSLAAWFKAVRRGDLRTESRRHRSRRRTARRRKYDWAAVQAYHDEGHRRIDCTRHFGFWPDAWTKAVQRGELIPRPYARSVEQMLSTTQSRASVKRRLLKEGILGNCCDECGLSEWRGRPISIQIDHRNGVRNDHRLENLADALSELP